MFSSVTGKDIGEIMSSFWLAWTSASCEALMKKARNKYSNSNWNYMGKLHYSEMCKRRYLLQQICFDNSKLLLILHLFYKVTSTYKYNWTTRATYRMYFLWNSGESETSRGHSPLQRSPEEICSHLLEWDPWIHSESSSLFFLLFFRYMFRVLFSAMLIVLWCRLYLHSTWILYHVQASHRIQRDTSSTFLDVSYQCF